MMLGFGIFAVFIVGSFGFLMGLFWKGAMIDRGED